MTSRALPRIVLSLSFAVCGIANAAPLSTESPASQPAADTKRTVDQIMKDFKAAAQGLQEPLSAKTIGDKAKRDAAAPAVIAALKKMQGYLAELKQADSPQGKQIASRVEPQLDTFLALFGDQASSDRLEKKAASSNNDEALSAKSAQLMVRWIKSSQDSAEQEKVLADAQSLIHSNPDNPNLIGVVGAMGEMGPANQEIAQKAMEFARAQQGQIADARQKKLESMTNKPLTIEGVRIDGSKFTTADWKGKVIFVDFWATWCGPCKAELPRVKKAYATYHDKGLEVLGVSCDNAADELTSFLNDNKDMPWPQLFDSKNPGWSPIATGYGIDSIPTMFLIDKKGILRSVTARENFEEMIPKLLEEKAE